MSLIALQTMKFLIRLATTRKLKKNYDFLYNLITGRTCLSQEHFYVNVLWEKIKIIRLGKW